MSASFYSCRDPRFTSLRFCPIFWETNRFTVKHLINYPASLIQYRLKHSAPGLPAKLNKFNLFESRTGGLLGMVQSVQCNRRAVFNHLPIKLQQQGNLNVYWQVNSKRNVSLAIYDFRKNSTHGHLIELVFLSVRKYVFKDHVTLVCVL